MQSSFSNTNSIIKQHAGLLDLVGREDLDELLSELEYDWVSRAFNKRARLLGEFSRHGLTEVGSAGLEINRIGILFLSRLLIHFPQGVHGEDGYGSLHQKYKDIRPLSSGKNSIVLLATHRILGTKVVLKIIRPGASADIKESVARLSEISRRTSLVLPIDYVEVNAQDILGKPVILDCLVFPYVEGVTFRDFLLQRNHHLNSQVVASFARQVALALYELERVGAYHGDLHEGNILVDQDAKPNVRFLIVDISYGAMGSVPLEECRNNDLANFKQHLWRLLSVQKSFLPGMSLRKYIGTRNYLRIVSALSDGVASFRQVCGALSDNSGYESYLERKGRFIAEQFKRPVSFRLQRYEEINDPRVAVELFVPFDPLIQSIRAFSNIFVSGNRGSGKSTYLASLAFFPSADGAQIDYRETFGIYFPCRQGEFRSLATRAKVAREVEGAITVHALVVKVIRRTLEILAAGVVARRIAYPSSLDGLRGFVEHLVPAPGLLSVEADIQSELENLVSTMVHIEMEVVGGIAGANIDLTQALSGATLIEFFSLIRGTFSELSRAHFHLLFDDAGSPYLPVCVQRAVCDLMLTSNSVFCVKLSAEKLTFDFSNSDGKALENGQDYLEHDISQILFIGSGSAGLNRSVLEQYFRNIVEQRLKTFKYKSARITDYVGDEQLSVDRLLKLLAYGRKDAYYCGWTTIWNIADRTPRNLLEIVSEIFSVGNIDRDTIPREVNRRDQDRAIRTISEKRLASLAQISGSLTTLGATRSLGRQLFEVTTAIGSTFRKYLRAGRTKERIRQHLAIERNDLTELVGDAETVLRRLITFGVLDGSRTGVARDDELRKPYYVLNRIYCPAFQIGYRRDEHLRLSARKLEMLLLQPEKFVREGTRRLREEPQPLTAGLFGFPDEGEGS